MNKPTRMLVGVHKKISCYSSKDENPVGTNEPSSYGSSSNPIRNGWDMNNHNEQ